MPTVVIIDDAVDIRMLVRFSLEAAGLGFEVIGEAEDGPSAVALIESLGQDAPDVILLDNRMPGMAGIEVANHIKDQLTRQKVVLFSAHLDGATIDAAEAAGVHACVGKERINELPGLLRDLVDRPDA